MGASPRDAVLQLREHMSASIIGQSAVVERLLLALLADGHVLMEGLPGLAKTRAIKSLAGHLESEFRRIQFTPDLLPSDITGSEIYIEQDGGQFRFQPGPIFGNLVLADEINRAPAKVQAALLEAMEERQVTVSGTRHPLPELFLVLATQNPIEQEGTYPLPEAQMDRFLMHVVIGYPSGDAERKILRLVRGEERAGAGGTNAASERVAAEAILAARAEVHAIAVADAAERYMVDLVQATREPGALDDELGRWLELGASPRGTLALDRVSRAHAWLHERDHVTPDDIRAVAADCLRHRIALSYEAEAEGRTRDDVLAQLLSRVAVP